MAKARKELTVGTKEKCLIDRLRRGEASTNLLAMSWRSGCLCAISLSTATPQPDEHNNTVLCVPYSQEPKGNAGLDRL